MNLRTELKRRLPEPVIKVIRNLRALTRKQSSENFLNPPETIADLRDQSMAFVSSLRTSHQGAFGGYRPFPESRHATVHASGAGLLLKHLYGLSESVAKSEAPWIARFQDPHDGMIHDPRSSHERVDLTAHALGVLSLYETPLPYPIKPAHILGDFRSVIDRLSGDDAWTLPNLGATASVIRNLGLILQYARDHQNCRDANSWLEAVSGVARARLPQLFAKDHAPGTPSLGPALLAGCELLELHHDQGWPVANAEPMVDALLTFQNRLGGFGSAWNSDASTDLAAIRGLSRLAGLTDYRKMDREHCFRRALPAILATYNGDGSWAYRRHHTPSVLLSPLQGKKNPRGLVATWLRTLALATCTHALPTASMTFSWTWHRVPGPQSA